MEAESRTSEYFVFRPEVEIQKLDAGGQRVRYALWEVEFSQPGIISTPGLSQLLEHRFFSRQNVQNALEAVLTLLDAQGCFLPLRPRELCLREIPAIFEPLRSKMYADYYSHPLWGRLRSGEASRAEIIAWIVHNYHVSRAAGPVAARLASSSCSDRLSSLFRSDAIDEYWHCDSFYFAKADALGLTGSHVKSYIAIPASVAFEDHALRAAETDWIGHLLIAYFQEASILFYDDSQEFYDVIEELYGLRGTFRGWRVHMAIDRNNQHAEGIKAAFDNSTPVSFDDLARSVRTVQIAHFFLLSALDEIAAHCKTGDALQTRQPRNILKLIEATYIERKPGIANQKPAVANYLIEVFSRASIRSLGFARSHDEIMTAGMIATGAARLLSAMGCNSGASNAISNPWVYALENFLIERTFKTDLFVILARELLAELNESPQNSLAEFSELAEAIEVLAASVHHGEKIPIELIQFRELICLAREDRVLAPLAIWSGGEQDTSSASLSDPGNG